MKTKQKWLNAILHLSSVIHKKKTSIYSAGIFKTIVLSFEVIGLELLLSIISLPFYFFITADKKFNSNSHQVKIYRLRRKLTLVALILFLFVYGVQLFLPLFGLFSFPHNSQAALITNGANAIDMLGQYDEASLSDPQPSYTKGAAHDAPNRLGFSSPQGAAFDSVHHRLFISDTSNNRVLVYNLNTDNTLPDRVPDNVLGQTNFASNAAGAATQAKMSGPYGLAYDSTNNRLFVAESGYSRVVVYDVTAITDGENVVNVLGQPNFTTSSGQATQAKMSSPRGVVYDSTNSRLFVADSGNNRVTVYDVASITDGENAVNVLGQPDFTTSSSSTTQAKMTSPYGVAYDGTNNRLFISETGVNRVTVFDITSITDGENAVNVLGQTSFTSNSPAFTAAGINGPQGVLYDAATNHLFVSQNTSNRVSVFDVTSISDGENAVNVLGQSIFTVNSSATTQSGLYSPFGLAYDTTNHRLYVTQGGNSRVSVFDITSITDGENAVDLLGQYDGASLLDPQPVYTKGSTLTDDNPNRLGFNAPQNMAIDSVHHRLFVADTGNNRVLIYNLNTDNTLLDRIPDNILGQSNFSSNASAASQSGMSSPRGLAYDGTNNRLFVAEQFNHRVKVYDVASITDGENAVNVLGQTNFTSNGSGNTQAKLNTPQGLAYDSTNNRLFVSQSGNNRVTVYDVASITDGENAVNVLGQANFTAFSAGNTQAGMNTPQGVVYDSTNNRLFVAQTGNNRVTVYDVASISDGENAVNVLGQANFTATSSANTQAGMSSPQGLAYDSTNNRLFVTQSGNNRMTVYDMTSITDGENAINVLGQSTYTDFGNATTQAGMYSPMGAFYDATNSRLFVADYGNNRVSTFNVSVAGFSVTQTSGSTAVTEGGATDSFDVVLTGQPSSNVVFDISSNDTTATTVSASTLTFTSSNWSTPQTITVTAPQDADIISETPVVTISVHDASSDDSWDPLADQTVNVTVTDNDSAGFSISETSGSTAVVEGGATDSFDVVLTAQPSSDVVFDVSSSDTTAAIVSASTLTFTTSNWNTPQTITVTGPQDGDTVSETPVVTVSVHDASSDNSWDPLADQTVNVTVTDNDVIGFSVTETSGSTAVTEGGSTDSFDVVLTAQPASDVVFDISSNDTSSATVSPSTLTFTSANWETPQTITVTAPQDADIVSETPVVTVAVNDASSDNAFDTLADQTVNVTVTDNDSSGFSVTETSGSTAVTEGGSTDSFDIVLTVQPSSDVVFDISSSDSSSATVSASSLIFTNSNWNTPQTITVTAPQDSNTISETPTITIAVNDASSDNAFDALADQTVNVSVLDTTVVVTNVTSSTANGTYLVSAAISLQVEFTDVVNVTGSPSITLATGDDNGVATYASGSGTNTLTFNYTVNAGNMSSDLDYEDINSLNLNGGSVKNTVGNDAILTLPTPGAAGSLGFNKNLVINGDVTAPTITNVTSSKANGTYGTDESIPIQIIFSEPVDVGGTPQLTLETGDSDAIALYTSGSGTDTLIFTYTVSSGESAADLDYVDVNSLSLNGGTIADSAMNDAVITLATPGSSGSLGNNKNITIDTTIPDTTAPTVMNVTSSKANGSYTVGENISIQVELSEVVQVSGMPRLILATGNGTDFANYESGTGTSILVFNYVVSSGQNSNDLDYQDQNAFDLNGATVTDNASNPAVVTLPSPGQSGSLGANKNLIIDTTAPTITNVTSSDTNGLYGINGIISIQVIFSKAVSVTGTPQLILETGNSDAILDYSSGSETTTLTFNYTINSGEKNADLDYAGINALALNSGTIQDAIGNSATLTLPVPGTFGSLGANKDFVVDGIPPAASTLILSEATTSSFLISWTAPGDDINEGTPSAYDIRYSTSLIDENNFDAASQVPSLPTPAVAGTNEELTVTGLSAGTTYYVAMKANDAAENFSALSNVANITTLTPVPPPDPTPPPPPDPTPSPSPDPEPAPMPRPILQTPHNTGGSGISFSNPSLKQPQPLPPPTPPPAIIFSDISNHWAQKYIMELHQKCNIEGYHDLNSAMRSFHPDATITRAELIAMLMKCRFGAVPLSFRKLFIDVPYFYWASGYIEKAWNSGILDRTQKMLRPNAAVTRAEALKMILLTFFSQPKIERTKSTLKCQDMIPTAWYAKYFNFALNNNIISGYEVQGKTSKTCAPESRLTRAEAAKLMVESQVAVNNK